MGCHVYNDHRRQVRLVQRKVELRMIMFKSLGHGLKFSFFSVVISCRMFRRVSFTVADLVLRLVSVGFSNFLSFI